MESIGGLIPLDIEKLKIKCEERKISDSRRKARRKLAVLKRDNFRCVQCQATANLTIDHVKKNRSREKGNHNATAYDPNDCQTLCVWCHSKKNGNRYL